jgi:outer membrane protein assembly factor BamD
MRKTLILLCVAVLALSVSCSKDSKKGRPFNAEEAFGEANKEYDKGFYTEARRQFEEVKRQDITGEYTPLAQLRIADSYLKSDEPALAIAAYQEFLDDYHRHKYAAYAQYKVGMTYFGLVQGPERGYGSALLALDAFLTLNEQYPRNPYRTEVEYRIQRCRDVIAGHEFLVADFYFRREAYYGTVERLTELLKDFPDYREKDEVYYRLAVGYKGLGQDENAREYLDLLKREYPSSKLINKAEKKFEDIMEERAEQSEAPTEADEE